MINDDLPAEPEVTLDIVVPKPPAEELPYKVVAISMYRDGLIELDAIVERCKAAGLTRMSRSRLIRIAIRRLDIERVIKDGRTLP